MIHRTKLMPRSRIARSSQALVLVSASIALVACASSQPERRGPRETATMPSGAMARPVAVVFATMDTNEDRIVSAAELASGVSAEWTFADRDQNGTVSVLEIGDWAEMSLGSRDTLPNHMSFDRDFSGSITQTEFAERLALEFEQLDIDTDQQLIRSELFFIVPTRINRAPSRSEQPASESGRGGGGRRGRGGGL